jgi:spore coat protein U-like protein
MKLTKLFLALASLSTLVVVSDTTAQAASPQSKSFTVTANVIPSCNIDAQATIAFGSYDPLSTADSTATGGVTITCTKGAAVTIGLTSGSNFASGTNNMKSSGTDLLAYKLYQPDGTTQWSDSEASDGTITGAGHVLSVTGSGPLTPISKSIVASLLHGQNISVGAYSDTVIALVNF